MRPTARALDASYRVSSDRGKGERRLRQSAEPSCPGGQSACDPSRRKSAPWTSIRGLPRDYRMFRKEVEVVALIVIAVTDVPEPKCDPDRQIITAHAALNNLTE
jgi:hypothetical protein